MSFAKNFNTVISLWDSPCYIERCSEYNRWNGYLGYTKVKGDTRYNEAKNAEIRDRKSM